MSEKFPRVAPQVVYDTAPGLGEFTDRVLFGQVWPSDALAQRDRSLLTVSALIAGGKFAQLASHSRRALDNGLTATELAEIATHLAFYTGWPNAMSAVSELNTVFGERELSVAAHSGEPPIDLPAAAESARAELIAQSVAPTAPILAQLTDDVLFGDLWRRPQLTPRDRSLVTMAALIMMGQPEQMPFHLNRALDNGLTSSEASAVLAHLAFYAGWPRAMSAVPILKQVMEARDA